MKTVIGGKNGEKFGYGHFINMAQAGMKITIRKKEYEFVDEFKYFGPESHGSFIPGLVLKPLGGDYYCDLKAYTYHALREMVQEKRAVITYEPI